MSGGDTIKTILRSFFLQLQNQITKSGALFRKKDQRRQTNQLANHSLEFKFQRFEVTTKFTTENLSEVQVHISEQFPNF